MVSVVLVLSVLKLLTVALGLYIVYLGSKAYRRAPNKTTLWLTVGMAVMTAGAVSEGLAFQGLHWSLEQSHVVEAIVTLLAFAFLVYSLHAE